jgi:integrase
VRELGLGPAAGRGEVRLAEARQRADKERQLLRSGIDPVERRRADKAAARAAAQDQKIRGRTFRQVAEEYLASHEKGWSLIHASQWSSSLKRLVYPLIGDVLIADIADAHVQAVLRPIWNSKPETASRVRNRMELIIDFARVAGLRTGENPARWRGHLEHVYSSKRKIATVQHFAALPIDDMPGLWADLAGRTEAAALALRFLILTSARTSEVLGAEVAEIRGDVWIIPAARMKGRREHRVPLTEAALDVLAEAEKWRQDPLGFVFQTPGSWKPVNKLAMGQLLNRLGYATTIHGMRSSFRDWASERTAVASDVIEMALAHVLGNAVTQAYQRGDLFEKRRHLMQQWASFLSRPPVAGDVVPLRSRS